MWQGLRNEDLNIDMGAQTAIVSSAKKTVVTSQRQLPHEEEERATAERAGCGRTIESEPGESALLSETAALHVMPGETWLSSSSAPSASSATMSRV